MKVMRGYDEIIARIKMLESEVHTFRKENEALYGEVKALRNDNKNNNKIVASLEYSIPFQLEKIVHEIEKLNKYNKQGYKLI